jgi:hypothetical protein
MRRPRAAVPTTSIIKASAWIPLVSVVDMPALMRTLDVEYRDRDEESGLPLQRYARLPFNPAHSVYRLRECIARRQGWELGRFIISARKARDGREFSLDDEDPLEYVAHPGESSFLPIVLYSKRVLNFRRA